MLTGLVPLAVILVVASVFAAVARAVRQPTIVAYLFAGIAVAFLPFITVGDNELFSFFSDLGIMFLLFLVGLEMNYASLTLVGRDAIIREFRKFIK